MDSASLLAERDAWRDLALRTLRALEVIMEDGSVTGGTLDEIRDRAIAAALRACHGEQARAAEQLGLSRRMMSYYVNKLQLHTA